jgi:peptidoglycan/LPS O-acetylase OafA/YrhL
MHVPGTRPAESDGAATEPVRPMSPGRMHFPALDGVRAVAALGVLVTHVALLSGTASRNSTFGPYLARMDVGVSIFFVLSGFLLYRPFVAARLAGAPRGDAGAYARRRLLRIFPAYWLALTVVAFVLRAPGFEEPHSIVAHYLLLHVYDAEQITGGPIQQSWTLAIELAFYLFVPCWAWLMSRRPRTERAQLRTEVVGLLALWAASTLANLALLGLDVEGSTFSQLGMWLPLRIGDFIPGMLLAVASAWITHRGLRLPTWVTGAAFPLACAAGALVVFWAMSTRLGLPVFPTYTANQAFAVRVAHTAFAVLVVTPVVFARQERGVVARTLANPVAVWLGLVSYGIYVWHEAWQDVYLRWTDQEFLTASFRGMLLATLALSVLSAAVSWYLVERPVIRWGIRPRR